MRHARPDYERFQDPAGIIPDAEPVFLIRGQDRAGPEAVRAWANAARRAGAAEDIIEAALRQANAMEKWQCTQAVKTPDWID